MISIPATDPGSGIFAHRRRYAKLLAQLSDRKFIAPRPTCGRTSCSFIPTFCPIDTKKDAAHWQGVLTGLDQLKAAAPLQLLPAARHNDPCMPQA